MASAIAAALGTVIASGILHSGKAVISRVKASDPGLKVTTNVIVDPMQGYNIVLPPGYTPTAREQGLMNMLDQDGFFALANSFRSDGGADVGQLLLQVNLTGKADGISITNLSLVNLMRTHSMGGTLFSVSSQGGGPTEQIVFNLDKTLPTPELIEPDGQIRPYFVARSIQLKKNESQAVVFTITSTRYAASFDVQVDYAIGGQVGHLLLDNQGKHYRVTALNCSGPVGTTGYQKVYGVTQGPQSLQLTPVSGGNGC